MKKILPFAALLFSCFTAFTQNNFYVAPGGNDANTGTLAQPWKTIQKAASTATAGSTIFIRQGTYLEKVNVTVNGTPNNYITFTNYPNETPRISGAAGSPAGITLWRMHNRRFLKVTGLTFTDHQKIDAQGVLIDGTSHHIEVRNCRFSKINFSADPTLPANPNRNSQPLIVYGTHATVAIHDLVIDGNEIFSNRLGYSEALAVNGNVNGFEVTNNTVRNNTNIGIVAIGHEGTSPNAANDQARNGIIRGNICYLNKSPYADCAGVYVDGARDILIERNRCDRNQHGIEVGCENVGKSASNITVQDNLVYNNDKAGLFLGGYDYPGGSGKVTNCVIRNNTFYKNDRLNDFTGEILFSYSENCHLENNIFFARRNVMFYEDIASINLTLNYNCWFGNVPAANAEFGNAFGFNAWKNSSGQDAQSLYANPLFTNGSLTAPVITLTPASPCLDAGNPAYIPPVAERDYYGEDRLTGTSVDIGGSESSPALQAASPVLVENFRAALYPNPAFAQQSIFVKIQPEEAPLAYEIRDVQGKMVSVGHTSGEIRLGDWAAGVYFITLHGQQAMHTERFILVKQ